MPKVSIIVPIFGVENYIERCARSLFCQTLDDLEYIFVNDCTPDKSMEVLQTVIDEYHPANVKIINHTVNKGLPQARKSGIDVATGEYVANCDSDDWLAPDFCSKLYERAVSSGADMVVCNLYFANDDHAEYIKWGDVSVYANPDLAFRYFLAEKIQVSVVLRIVRREIAQRKELLTPKKYSAEDWSIVVQWMYFCKKIEYVDCPLYYYYTGTQTQSRHLTVENCIKNCCQKRDNVRMVCRWLSMREKLSDYKSEITSVKGQTKQMLFPVMDNPECRKLWRRTFREINISILWNKYLTRKYKVQHFKYLLGGLYPIVVSALHIFKKYD